MSGTVDTRTVEMRFDNKNFESNVKQSMSTLDKLKQKLKLDGATKGLKEVERSSKKLDFRDTNDSVGKLGKSFSILEEMAKGAFRKMGAEAYAQGLKIAKSLSVDQIAAGWNKYADKTTAVQTIMASIKDDTSKFVDEASKMEYVNKSLEKLQWFSDETSYSFTDMTGNVGKFIANGQDLEQSVTAMQGIATWAAVSGQNAQTASRAMYNISQAMGVGSMKIKDWMSIENANMATAQFKELAITIGQKRGKIKEGQVTIENFRESLSGKDTNGWFDKDVMMEVFETYGEAADRIQEYAKTHGVTSTEAIREIKKQDAAFADSLGFKAFAAAQEAKTFKEVMDATADAASTKWLQFFENIFGNYLQAKELWTNLSEDLYDIFVEPLNELNDVMSVWNKGFVDPDSKVFYNYSKVATSGREMLIGGFKNLLDTFFHDTEDEFGNEMLSIVGIIKRAFQEIFFPGSDTDSLGKKLWDLTKKFKDFTDKLKPSQETIEKIKNSFKGFFTIFKIAGKFIGAIIKPFKELFGRIFGAEPGKGLLNALDSVSNWIQNLDKALDEEGIFDKVSQGISDGIQKVIDALNWVSQALTGLSLSDLFQKIKTDISDFFKNYNFKEKFESIGNFFKGSVEEISQVETGELPNKLTPLQSFWKGLKGILKGLSGVLSFIFQKIVPALAQAFGAVGDLIGKLFGGLSGKKANKEADTASSNIEEAGGKLEKAAEKVNPVVNVLKNIFQGIKNFFEKASPFFEKLSKWIAESLGKFGEFLGKLAEDGNLGKNIQNFAKGGFFIALILLIGNIRKIIKEFKGIVGNISGLFGDIRKRMKKKNKLNNFKSIAVSILMIAGALLLVAKAFDVFAKIEFNNTSVGVIAAIFAGFIAISVAVAFASKKILKEKQDTKALYSMAAFMIVISFFLNRITKTFERFAKIKFSNTSAEVITLIFAAFIGITTLVAWAATKFLKDEQSTASLNRMADFMTDVALALIPLSIAMWIAGKATVDPSIMNTVAITFGAFIGLTTIVAIAATKFLKNDADAAMKILPMISGFMNAVAGALVILSAALWIIGKANLDPSVATTAGIIFGAFIVLTTIVAVAAAKFLKDGTGTEKTLPLISGFMIAAAVALVILAAAFKIFSSIDFDKTPIGAISLIFAGFIVLTGGLAILGGLLMKNGSSIAGIAMMAGFMLTAAVSLAIVALAFGQLASNISPEQMTAALAVMITFAAVVALLAVIGTVLAGTGFGTVGMALVAAIIIAIGAACLMAGAGIALMVTSISNLITAFGSLMQAIATYGPGFAQNVQTVVEAVLDTIISLAPKMKDAAVAVIKALALGLITAAPIVSKALVLLLVYLMQNVRETLNTTVPILVMTIVDLIDTLANVLRDSAPLMTKAVRNLIEAIIETVIVSIAGIVEPFGSVGEWIAEKVTGWIPGLREAFKVAEDTETVLDHIGETPDTTVAVDVGDSEAAGEGGEKDATAYLEAFKSKTESTEKGDLVDGLLSNLGIEGTDMSSMLGGGDMSSMFGGETDTSMFSDVMTGKVGDMTEAIKEETPATREASEGMAKAIEDPITALDSRKWGEDIGRELSNGILSKRDRIKQVCNATAEIIHDILGFSEPKEGPLSDFHTYAPDMIKLWCKGIRDNMGSVDKSSDSIANGVEERFSTALDYVSGLIDGGMTDELTIRPVMDLSEIQNGVQLLNSMLGNNDYSLYGTVGLASSAAYGMRSTAPEGQTPVQQTTVGGDTYHNTFNITNSDPNAVAEKVSAIIQHQVKRKQAVWATTR